MGYGKSKGWFCDFVVDYNPDESAMAKEIICHLTLHRSRANKPTFVFITGGSGEAKSSIVLRCIEAILEKQGFALKDYLEDIIVFTPREYAVKTNALLFEPRLRKINVLVLDEAKQVVSSKKWFSFVTQTINEIDAIFRQIKPLIVFVVSPFSTDVTPDTRRQMTYYGVCKRPLYDSPSLHLSRFWMDDRNIERPILRKRPVWGYVKKDGQYSKKYLNIKFRMPPLDIWKRYNELAFTAKAKIIKQKLELLLKTFEEDEITINEKVGKIIDFYLDRPDWLKKLFIVKMKKATGVWKVKTTPEFDVIHKFTTVEKDELCKQIIVKMQERGLSAATATAKE